MSPPYETQNTWIPQYSMIGPFRGHMSIKSSPFYTGSSCKLSTQYLIQDHMAAHYKKLLTTKAAVDTSTPKSLYNSIKFKDQQKKEKLLEAVDLYKKEQQRICSPAHHQSKSHFLEQWKVLFSKPGEEIHEQRRATQARSPVLIGRDTMRTMEGEGYIQGDAVTAAIQPWRSQTRHRNETPKQKAYKDPEKKAYSGDILDKHATRFTSTKQWFKPRLLKKTAQSFLSNSKHYTSPRKSNAAPQPRGDQHGAEPLIESHRSLESKDLQLETTSQEQSLGTENGNLPGARRSQHLEQEEEIKYLRFLQDVTNDILIRGCGSERTIENVFQEHLQRKEHDIDEENKKHLMEELKAELQGSPKLDFSISNDGTQYRSEALPLRGILLARLLSSHAPQSARDIRTDRETGSKM
ncbi:spermatogenesis-associated protein 7 homolog isoform X2 [Xenopus tropicalis]|uniref:Spermatogenesis-associated protein 7 homolog n=1 Tax=Xenopus tropicalis TaxID=8364 RepID=A0A6I8S8R4_XENTR|nr:spermatogenesis-associated protein 7 homolog isoform X2 [Xenopus tropicalis]